MLWLDYVGLAFIWGGIVFCAIGVYGTSRFTDVLNRLHAFGEISTIGMAGILIGGALIMPNTWVKMVGLAVFLIISAPTATHAVGVVVTHIGQTARHYKPTEAEQSQV